MMEEVRPAELGNVRRRLAIPLFALVLFAAVLEGLSIAGAYRALEAERRAERRVAVAAERQSLAAAYDESIYVALIALSTSDWELLLAERRRATNLEARLAETNEELETGASPALLAALERSQHAWRNAKRRTLVLLRGDRWEIQHNPELANLKAESRELLAALDAEHAIVRTEARREASASVYARFGYPSAALLILAVLGAFTYRRVVVPLADTTDSLARRDADLADANAKLEARVAARTAELEASQKTLQAILDHSPAVVYIKDENGRYVLVNHRYLELLGLRESDVLGHEDSELMEASMASRLRANDEAVLLAGRPIVFEEEVRHGDTSRQYLAIKFPIELPTGRTAICGISSDITLRVEAEAKLSRLNVELEERVAERTAELQTANHELDAFCSSVSHDLRAPVRHVAGFAEKLRRHANLSPNPDPELERLSGIIVGAARRMGHLIDDLLSFSRAARVEIRRTPVELATVVNEVIRGLEPDAVGRDIEWRVGDLPCVEADPALLRQVFANLLGNALKFTRARRTAHIEVGSEKADGETVVFVRDDGAGFDMKYAHKLFQVFQRLHADDEFEGTGVGLATVRRIVERHGGRSWAEAVPHVGATFYLAFPHPGGAELTERAHCGAAAGGSS